MKKALITGQDGPYIAEFLLEDGLGVAYQWFIQHQDQFRGVHD